MRAAQCPPPPHLGQVVPDDALLSARPGGVVGCAAAALRGPCRGGEAAQRVHPVGPLAPEVQRQAGDEEGGLEAEDKHHANGRVDGEVPGERRREDGRGGKSRMGGEGEMGGGRNQGGLMRLMDHFRQEGMVGLDSIAPEGAQHPPGSQCRLQQGMKKPTAAVHRFISPPLPGQPRSSARPINDRLSSISCLRGASPSSATASRTC